jgi:phenylacetate-CoA ligase
MISKPTKFLIRKLLTESSPSYHFTKRYIVKTERLSTEQLQDIQFNNLKKVLRNAFANVPYYQRTWRSIGFDPINFKHIEDLTQLPFIDKCVYRENSSDFISKKYIKRLMPTVYTGGTTGAPLLLYRSYGDYGRERAFREYAYRTLGMNIAVKTIYMRGKVSDEKGIYHKLSDFGNTLYLSSHNMKDEQIAEYIERIREFKPVLFYALPSVATVFGEYMHRKKVPHFDTLKWLWCPSENLYDFQRKLLENVFKCKIGTLYGHAEHAVFAVKCDKSDMYHMLPQYGYCELIDGKERTIKEEGVLGEIVGTSFANAVSPLVRYRTGDYAVYTTKNCPCGRNYMMLEKLQGREQCLAVDKRHARISVGPELLCTIHDKSYGMIKQFRIEQFKAGELDVLIDCHEPRNFTAASDLFKAFFEREYPGLFDINVKQIENEKIKKTTDKHLYFIQHIKQ